MNKLRARWYQPKKAMMHFYLWHAYRYSIFMVNLIHCIHNYFWNVSRGLATMIIVIMIVSITVISIVMFILRISLFIAAHITVCIVVIMSVIVIISIMSRE